MKQLAAAALFAALISLAGPVPVAAQNREPAATAHGEKATEHAEAATHGGEQHAEEAMPNENLWKWANFALLAAGLGYLIAKNAPGFFNARTEQIRGGIAEATRMREEAEARAAAIERRVSNLSAEVEQLRTQSREEIAREGERMRAEAETAMRKIQAQSQAEMDAAVKHASHDLKAYGAKLALELAERQIRDRMSPGTQDGLASAFIEEVKRKAGRN